MHAHLCTMTRQGRGARAWQWLNASSTSIGGSSIKRYKWWQYSSSSSSRAESGVVPLVKHQQYCMHPASEISLGSSNHVHAHLRTMTRHGRGARAWQSAKALRTAMPRMMAWHRTTRACHLRSRHSRRRSCFVSVLSSVCTKGCDGYDEHGELVCMEAWVKHQCVGRTSGRATCAAATAAAAAACRVCMEGQDNAGTASTDCLSCIL